MKRGIFIIHSLVAVGCHGTTLQDCPTNALVFDCGVNAVYTLLRLKDMNVDLPEISRNLARDLENGSSIHDVETYLHEHGIKTDARMMRLSGLAQKRGALAVLLLHKHGADVAGHYVVARALGNGRLQVIDSLAGATINEDAESSKERFPVILVDPVERGWTWMILAGVSIASLGASCFIRK